MAISVREYIENKELLETTYVPYAMKVEIIDAMIDNAREVNDGKIDDASMDRIFDEVIITASTNIDMSIIDEDTQLDGYDLLMAYDAYDELISVIDKEYYRYFSIYTNKIKTIERYELSTGAIISKIKEDIMEQINSVLYSASQAVNNFDSESFVKQLSSMIDQKLEERELK